MIAIVVAHIGYSWGLLTLFYEVPAYMDKVMGVNIKTVSYNQNVVVLFEICEDRFGQVGRSPGIKQRPRVKIPQGASICVMSIVIIWF